jgi:hypothetical protein
VNNILLSDHATRGAISISTDSLAGFVSDYNIAIGRFTTDGGDTILSLSQWRAVTGQDIHSFTSAASNLFVNPADADYHLKLTSPAIDAGTSQYAAKSDLEGHDRPVGSAHDIGAYELVP